MQAGHGGREQAGQAAGKAGQAARWEAATSGQDKHGSRQREAAKAGQLGAGQTGACGWQPVAHAPRAPFPALSTA